MDRIMENHASIMASSINPQVLVLTNIALDHIGLVDSVEDVFKEVSRVVNVFKGKHVVLNSDDPHIRKMEKFLSDEVSIICYGAGSQLEFQEKGIFYNEDILLKKEELPFKSPHFIQNTMAAIGAALELDIDLSIIKKALMSYKPLDRRFALLSRKPLIIDDFAHNPDGIRATIKSASELTEGRLLIVAAIRGSRGKPINQRNAEAIAGALEGIDHLLIITSSVEMVDEANYVKPSEKKIFTETLTQKNLNYIFHDKLCDALDYALESADDSDAILLIGAQGMDSALELLKKMNLGDNWS